MTSRPMRGIKNKYFKNWANTYACRPELYFEPESVDELREVLALAQSAGKKVRVAGVGHSPSSIACTTEYMISLRKFDKLIDIDTENLWVKVQGGMMMDKLNPLLEKNNMSLSVLGSISDQTIAGAISVAYHGTGINYGVLSSYVLEVELMSASGELKTYSPTINSDEFGAVLCSLGCLGVIVSVKLQCERAFRLEQIEHGANLEDVLQSLDVYVKSCDHFRMLWFPHTDFAQCYSATRTSKPIKRKQSSWLMDRFIVYYLLEFLYWIGIYVSFIIPLINYVYYKLFADRKEYIDVSYRIFNFDCLFKQYAFEVAIPIKETAHYLLKLKTWLDNNPNIRVHFGVEIRFVKSDEVWLSPCYDQDSCYINILMFKPYGIDYPKDKWWKINEDLMLECNGRPHWAKTHKLTRSDFVRLYPKFNDFDELRKKLDPTDMFINDCLRPVFYD